MHGVPEISNSKITARHQNGIPEVSSLASVSIPTHKCLYCEASPSLGFPYPQSDSGLMCGLMPLGTTL